ncbi:hypothetical protein [Mycobacterium novum]
MTREGKRGRYAANLRAGQSQSRRLTEVRARVGAEKRKALAAEPWSGMVTVVPTVGTGGELTGMLSMLVADGKELFGGRLAYDLLGCCDGEDSLERHGGDYESRLRLADAALNAWATRMDERNGVES